MGKTGFVYLFAVLLCVLFGAVYEYFSHEVFSYYMLYAFVFPLVGGVFPYFYMALSGCRLPSGLSYNLYNSGIAALTVGSIFNGVLEIYGTTNKLVCVYWIAGAALIIFGIIFFLFSPKLKRRN